MKRILILSLALAAAPSIASAEPGYRVGRWDLGLNPGIAVPVGTTAATMSNSGQVQLTGGYQYNDYINTGAEIQMQFDHRFGGTTAGQLSQDYLHDGQGVEAPFSSNIRERVFGISPFIKIGPWVDVLSYKFRPYFVASAGLYHAWTTSGIVTVSGTDKITGNQVGPITQTYDTSSNSYFGFAAGGGFDIQVDENAALGIDLRFSRLVKPYENLEYLTPSLRISYLF